MTLDDALGQPGRLVAAWDHRWPSRAVLDIYVTSDAGANRIHSEEVPLEQREALADRVRDRGVRLGGSYSYTGHVWVLDDRGVGVWNAKASLVEGSQIVVGLRSGAVKARDIKRVTTFIDPSDVSHRGIRCDLAAGSPAIFVEERHEAAKADPFYDDERLHEDMRWAILLGQDLAMWLGVPHVDQDGDVTNTRQLEVAKQARTLADIIDKLPATGELEHVIHVLGTFPPLGKLQVRYAPNPMDLAKRFLELRLFTPSGKSSWARWIKQGTNEHVAAYLRSLRTPWSILIHMDEMARKLAQEQYE